MPTEKINESARQSSYFRKGMEIASAELAGQGQSICNGYKGEIDPRVMVQLFVEGPNGPGLRIFGVRVGHRPGPEHVVDRESRRHR